MKYKPHPHIKNRKEQGPILTAHQLPSDSPTKRFNTWLALKVTAGVGTMWCAYVFAALALTSASQAVNSFISGDTQAGVAWLSQAFLQLVLLPIIIVGQNIQAQASDKRAQQTYEDAEAVLHEAKQIQVHLLEQDSELKKIISNFEAKKK